MQHVWGNWPHDFGSVFFKVGECDGTSVALALFTIQLGNVFVLPRSVIRTRGDGGRRAEAHLADCVEEWNF